MLMLKRVTKEESETPLSDAPQHMQCSDLSHKNHAKEVHIIMSIPVYPSKSVQQKDHPAWQQNPLSQQCLFHPLKLLKRQDQSTACLSHATIYLLLLSDK